MSILIKGMEMPQEGCAVAVIFSDGETLVYTGEPLSEIVCKAIPVPPHGRLGYLFNAFAAIEQALIAVKRRKE